MEPWSEEFRHTQEKSFGQKCVEAAVVIYAGFAICVIATLAETVTIPLSEKWRQRRKRKNESR